MFIQTLIHKIIHKVCGRTVGVAKLLVFLWTLLVETRFIASHNLIFLWKNYQAEAGDDSETPFHTV